MAAAPVNSRPARRRRRWLWIFLAGFLLGSVVMVALLLTAPVQGWLVRRIMSGQPGLSLEFDRLQVGPTGVDVVGLDFAMPGLRARSAPVAIRIAPGRLLNRRELRIERVEARKLRVTITPADLPSSKEPFAGILPLLQSPLAWALDEAELDGEIVVQDGGNPIVVGTFTLLGGRVSANQPGEFTYELSVDSALLPSAPVSKAHSRGTVRLTQGSNHEVSRIDITGDLALPTYGGVTLPAGKFSLSVAAAPSGETYRAQLDFAPAASLAFEGRLDAAAARFTGRFTTRADDALVSSGGVPLPALALNATADVSVDLRRNDSDLAWEGTLVVDKLERIAGPLAAIGSVDGKLAGRLSHRGGRSVLQALELTLAAKNSPARVTLTTATPVALAESSVPLAVLAIHRLPLAWANPSLVPAGLALEPGEINATWDLRVAAGTRTVTLTPRDDLTVQPVALKGAKLPPLPALNVSLRPDITLSWEKVALNIGAFTASTQEGDRLTGQFSADYTLSNQNLAFAGEVEGSLPTLLSGPNRPLPFALHGRWSGELRDQQLRVDALQLNARKDSSAPPYLAVSLLQPLSVDLAKFTTPAGAAAANWAKLRFDALPLDWISRWIAPRELTGTLATGEAVLRSSSTGHLSFETVTPFQLLDATVGFGGRTFFSGGAAIVPSLAVQADHYRLELRDISASHRDGSRIRGSISAEAQLREKKGSTEVSFDAELPALQHSAGTFGAVSATLRLKSHNEGTTIAVVDEFSLRLRNAERELASVEATGPFLAGLSNSGMFSAGTVSPLKLTTGEIPIAWVKPWLPNLEADGVLQPAEFQLTAQLTKFLLRPIKPVHIRDFSARVAGRDIARAMDFQFYPGLDLTLICIPAPTFQLAYSGTVHLTSGAIDVQGERAVDVDAALSFIGNDQRVLPSGVEYSTRADFAQLSRVPALRGSGLPDRGTLVARLNGELLGKSPLEFWARLADVPSADRKRVLPAVELSARGRMSPDQTLVADVAARIESAPRASDVRFEAKLNLAAGDLQVATALQSDFLDLSEALAISEGLYAPTQEPTTANPATSKPAAGAVTPQPAAGSPAWSRLRGHFDLRLGTVRYAPYQIDRVTGRIDLGAEKLELSNLAGEMFSGRWSGGAQIAYRPGPDADHHATGEFKIDQFDSARVVQTVFPTELATVDAKLDVIAHVRSRGNNLFELIDRAEADFVAESRQGVVRLNVPKQDMAASAAVFGGTVLLSPELRALGRLMKKFAEMPVDRLRIAGARTESGEVQLSEFRLDSPQARMLAHGQIPLVVGEPLMNRPLQLSIDLAAKDEMAAILGGMKLIEAKPRADGYRALKEKFELRGKAGSPDTRPLYDLLAKAVLGSKGTWGFLMRRVQDQVQKTKAAEPQRAATP